MEIGLSHDIPFYGPDVADLLIAELSIEIRIVGQPGTVSSDERPVDIAVLNALHRDRQIALHRGLDQPGGEPRLRQNS